MDLEIDLHNLTAIEAKIQLDSFLNTAPKGKVTVIVIHGSNRGSVLQKMVRSQYKHKRIDKKILGLNQGITELILK